MPKVKLTSIVSCSSEDPVHNSSNLLNNNDTNKKWRSRKFGEPSISVIIQLEKSYNICGIDIGNDNSSFIEVFVGRSTIQEYDYQILLAMSSFMSPTDARNLVNSNRVRLFTYNDLTAPAKDEKWDRLKIICTQPFNKTVQYGLSFITVHAKEKPTEDDKNAEESSTSKNLGRFKIRPESPDYLTAGSIFARRNELKETNMTIAQEIKTSLTPTVVNDFKIKEKKQQPSVTTPKRKDKHLKTNESNTVEKKEKNRNRQDLFYDEDDNEKNDKIDNIIDRVRSEEQKGKQKPTVDNISTSMKKDNSVNKKNSTRKTDKMATKYATALQVSDSSPTPSTSKRKLTNNNSETNKKVKILKTKAFNELLSGTVFTISGIVNPERANLRQMAIDMGAKYRPDWDSTCTHLICAFANTPKFLQVQGKGKIVTKQWILDCNAQRKYLPWRRYALDRNDQGVPESDEEINETKQIDMKLLTDHDDEDDDNDEKLRKLDSKQTERVSDDDDDTDDEIEKILQKQQATKINVKQSNEKTQVQDDPDFGMETDEEKMEKNPKEIDAKILPQIFTTEVFYVDNSLNKNDKVKLERYIKALNGVVLTRTSAIIDFVITTKDLLDKLKDRAPNAKCISSEWIFDCYNQLKLLPYNDYSLE